MNITRAGRVAPYMSHCLVVAAMLPLVACGVVVREDGEGNEKRVDIRSPFGRVLVETNGEMADTGLPVYPGARPLRRSGRDRDEPDSANVTIGTSFFGMRVAASKFESDDTPEAVIAFYRERMKQYGEVTECRGELDFKRRRVVCKDRFRDDVVTLGVGTSDRHRIVAVKTRNGRTRLDVVFIDTDDRS